MVGLLHVTDGIEPLSGGGEEYPKVFVCESQRHPISVRMPEKANVTLLTKNKIILKNFFHEANL